MVGASTRSNRVTITFVNNDRDRQLTPFLLFRFIDSGVETAVFLEDDVDWDIRLRTVQAPLVSTAMRRLSPNVDAHRYPYGNPKTWDLLYLGHCGDYWHGIDEGFVKGHIHPSDLEHTPHIAFNDPSMTSLNALHPFTESLLVNLGIPDRTRLIHQSVFPLCTFGYALTRAGATRLLEASGSKSKGKGQNAYDIFILHMCRNTGLQCWSVNPELFHHMPGPSIISIQDHTKDLPPVDAAAKDQAHTRGETANINCGFWDGTFSFEDEDVDRLNWLREEVGRKGRCLKVGRELPG